ncbi:MAG: NADH-quinone oxidoreductase subunit H [Opitutaceae bacterium]|nr:NADH-quinone oxidoreductase subunit H [Cytophagales bacterium]
MQFILPLIYLGFALIVIIIIFYSERKLAAFIQDRLGPTEVGFVGTLQPIADLLKMVQKEDIIPTGSNSVLFRASPLFIFLVVFAGFAFIPIAPGVYPVVSNIGVFFCLTIISLDIIGLLMAGWSADNKFALLGAMRSVAQIISYEIPIGITVLTAIVLSGSMDLNQIALDQSFWTNKEFWLLGIKQLGINTTQIGGFLHWNLFQSPFMFITYIIFYIATLAECNRAPFDLPEAESELVAGYHAEYSGIRFGIFFLAEYAMMVLVSLLGAFLFLGAWSTPFPNMGAFKLGSWTSGVYGEWSAIAWSSFWVITKTITPCIAMIWIRWTFPRLRTDQLMYLCWKVLIPFSLLGFLLVCLGKYFLIS